MRIAVVHCKYLEKGGEDVVFEQECKLLSTSEEVEAITFYNRPGVRGLIQFIISFWNIFSAYYLKRALHKYKPDILHLHNWHFALGPIVVYAAKNAGIPIVLTLHNYRLLCPSGTLLYKRKLFLKSVKSGFPWEAIVKGVYKQSILLTFWLSFVIWFHKLIGTWKKVDKYIVLTNSCKELFVNSSLGISENKFYVKPNFVIAPVDFAYDADKQGEQFLYVGRLSDEKGIHTLLDAFANTSYELQIAGDGPLASYVRQFCSSHKNISYMGSVDRNEVRALMQRCSSLIFSSIWYEPFGNVIIEAFASGCHVIASNIGSPAELIRNQYNGLHFEAGNSVSLRMKLAEWQFLDKSKKDEFRKNCLETYKMFYSPEKNKVHLLNIYNSMLSGM